MWKKLKELHNGTLPYLIIRYGEEDGTARYIKTNKKKTASFDHSSETQRARAEKSAAKSRGNKSFSVRNIGYWINKGFTKEEATTKVANIQATNTVSRYIKKYGEAEGPIKFKERNEKWVRKMNDNPEICRKRSLGLWRYIERYGPEEGQEKYKAMRKKKNDHSSVGNASLESIKAFTLILDILDQHSLKYYIGVPDNREWCIYSDEQKQFFFYDLTIPSLDIIIEYHGEAWHPNPRWEKEKLEQWRQVVTNHSSADVAKKTELKNKTARDNGWNLFEVFSSEVSITIPTILEHISKLGYS